MAENKDSIWKITAKKYRCTKCGCITIQNTNHNGSTWSSGHWNCCPQCPPYAKYPEFGGQTLWEYVSHE
jgi:hypothetical protein